MNATPTTTPMPAPAQHSRSLIKQLAVPAVFMLAAALLAIGITGFFRLGRDARCLRNSLTSSIANAQVACQKRIELSVGSISFALLRTGLSFAPLPPEAQLALQSVRGAEVGYYEFSSGLETLEHGALLTAADSAMEKIGWDRLVGVLKDGEFVAVYVPSQQGSGAALQACVAVLHGNDLVVVRARGQVEPLLELANSKIGTSRAWAPLRL